MAQGDKRTPFSEDQVKRAVAELRSALQSGRSEVAVRECMQLVSSGLAGTKERVLHWFVSTIGKSLTAKLVEAFVHFPCFWCEKGRATCDACDGRGMAESGLPCEQCVGTRLRRCDFCNGSGWVTINYVPEGLRPLVVKRRTAVAAEKMKSLLAQPMSKTSSRDPRTAIRRNCSLLLEVDRRMGVFENMLLAARSLAGDAGPAKAPVEPSVARCLPLAAQAEARICELIRAIAESHRQLAGTIERGSQERRRFEQWARHYDSLVDPERSLAGTGLMHPFLHAAIKKLRHRRAGT